MSIMHLPVLIVGAGKPARKSKSLELAKEGSSKFDTHVLDAAENPGIGDVRNLQGNFSRRPFESKYQTFIILEAQNLTLEAQNALLKILEEPAASVKILLTAPTSEGLLSTITSRCQKLELTGNLEEVIDEALFKKFLNSDSYERYKMIDKLDIEAWEAAWRRVLLNLFTSGEARQLKGVQGAKILNYVKLVAKMKSLRKRRASIKLIKSLLLLSIPPVSLVGEGL